MKVSKNIEIEITSSAFTIVVIIEFMLLKMYNNLSSITLNILIIFNYIMLHNKFLYIILRIFITTIHSFIIILIIIILTILYILI